MEKIGRGGFATVWKALDQRTGEWVAVKVLHAHLAEDPGRCARFYRGAAEMARLQHPGVVRIVDPKGEEGGWHYFVMELVEGTDLEQAVLQGRVGSEAVPEIVLAVAEALHHAHEHGLVHRDVSPSNVLLDGRGRPHLTDFDLVWLADKTGGTRTGFMGKFFYAAPDVADHPERVDRRADVYSLGMTAIFAWSGKPLTAAVIRKTEAFIAALPCPAPVKRVLGKAVETEAADRYATVAEFADALRAALAVPGLSPAAGGVPGSIEGSRIYVFDVVTVDARGRETNRHKGETRGWAEDLGGGVVLDMVVIPGGTFEMGSPESEVERLEEEGPQHHVTLSAFAAGRFQVTQAQWHAAAGWARVSRDLRPDPARFKGADRPVEVVSWLDAIEFCARLSAKTGRRYRLPSEAEWEYAARAGTATPFCFGQTLTPELANYNGNYPYGAGPKGPHRKETTAVGAMGVANEFGLFDVHGNVWEWCQDGWHGNYVGAPTDGSPWEPNDPEAPRVFRGGSWDHIALYCRSAYRLRHAPGDRFDHLGFRVVCSVARTP